MPLELATPVELAIFPADELEDGSFPIPLIICIMKADMALDIMLDPLASTPGVEAEAVEPELPC